uniref:Uncharacterized protein n=1 Tax=Fagus sylvatica TaxID=28930 RepID=A0A2N9H3G0_FAGSY
MAEAIPFGLAQKIIERLSSMAVEEIGSIWGVKRDWLMKLKDVAYDADDVMSAFSTEDLRQSVMDGGKMTKKVRTFFSSSNQLAFRLKMAHKIKAIREKLDAIANDKTKLQLVESPFQEGVVTRKRDQTHSFICEEEVIGRENEKKTIIDMLLNSDEEENVSFISIVGFGGLGKTTLAQYVFNDEKVKTCFDLKMWVCVSDVFDVKAIAENIIRCTTDKKVENLDTMEQVQKQLRERLQQKKYLLVLDDVWNEDKEHWCDLKKLLMGGSKGSKVVITTRNKLVAKITSKISPISLKGLSEDQSWSLLKQMAFETGQETIDPKLQAIGMDILEKCYGVPLAIKTIGRMLLFKETEEEWLYIKNKELRSVTQGVRHLSVQIYSGFEDDLSSLAKAKKIRTFFRFGYRLVNLQTLKLSYCRKLKALSRDIQKLVSLQHLEIDGCKSLTHMPCGIVQLTSLRTLNLSKCEKFKELPRDIQKLVNLKHLEIDYCESLTHMSCGLWQLTSLQTLKLFGCMQLKELPREIKKLVALKHLEIDRWKSLTHMPYGIGQLNSLQTLPLFVVSKDLAASSSKHCGGLGELNKLNNLRGELCIKNLAWVTDATLEAKTANLKEKRHLKSLELSWDSEDNNNTYVSDDENVLEGLQPHHTLKELKVKGYRGVSFPSWLPLVTSLVELKISNSMCQHLSPLYQLPSLRELFLYRIIGLEYITDREITDEFSASTTFFPSLKTLRLENCPNLKGWWRRDIVDAATTTSISSNQYQQHISLPSFPCLSYFLKPLQETMAMTMNMSATSSLPSSSSSSPPLSKLKSLALEGIQDVESLPEELLQNLASLEDLTIWSCPRLKSLPRFMQHLTSLKKLHIGKCKELDLFSEESDDSTQCVTTLQELEISVYHRLITLPKWIGNVTSLQRLDISKCPNLTSLPEGIGNLTSLQRLDISKCPKLTSLPEGIGNLTSLQRLDISKCPKLTSLPEEIVNLTSIQSLAILDCPNLNSLPQGIGKLTSFQSLQISKCPDLNSLLEGIGNLTSLHIGDCPHLTSLPEGISNLTSLQTLIIRKCPHLKERCRERIGEDWHKIAHIPYFEYIDY